MPAEWTLKRGDGQVRTLAEEGITACVRRLANQATGTVTLLLSRESVLSETPIKYGEQIRILRDAAGWFTGTCSDRDNVGEGATENITLTISDPWWDLERLIYRETAKFVIDPNQTPLPYPSPVSDAQRTANAAALSLLTSYTQTSLESSFVRLGKDDVDATLTTTAWISRVLTFAIAHGAPFQAGAVDAGLAVPSEQLRDATCADCIRKALRWTPDLTPFFDYSTAPPTLHIRKRRNKNALSIAIGDGTLTHLDLSARRDLQLPGVTINFIRRNRRPGLEFLSLEKQTAGAAAKAGALSLSIELAGSNARLANGSLVLTPAEATPAGLAQRIFDAFADLHFSGRITTVLDDVLAAGNPVGKRVVIPDGKPAWADMAAEVQSATDEVVTGRTELIVGPPSVLGAGDFVELSKLGRLQPSDVTIPGYGSPGTGGPISDTPTQPEYPTLGSPPDGVYNESSVNGFLSNYEVFDFFRDDTTLVAAEPATRVPLAGYGGPRIANGVNYGIAHSRHQASSSATDGGGQSRINTNSRDIYTSYTLDLTGAQALSAGKIILAGTQIRVLTSGTVNTPAYVDLTALKGTVSTFVCPVPPAGDERPNSFNGYSQGTDSLSYPKIRFYT